MNGTSGFVGFLARVGLLIALFAGGPTLLFILSTSHADSLSVRGKYHKAYRFTRAVYYFTDIPLLRLWIGKYRYLQLQLLSEQAEKIGNRTAAIEWLRLAVDSRFAPSERIKASSRLATLLRKQNRFEEAEAVEADALAIVPNPTLLSKNAETESSRAGIARAALLIRKGRFTEALTLLDQAKKAAGADRFLIENEQATALRQLGRYEEAAATYEVYEQKHRVMMEKIRARMSQNLDSMNIKAENTLRFTLDQIGTSHYLTIIQLCLEAGKSDIAMEHWKRLPQTLNDLTRATQCAVGAWLFATRRDEAVATAQMAKAESSPIREEEARQRVASLLARAEYALQNYQGAVVRLAKLVEDTACLPLAQAEYRVLLARSLNKIGQTEDARIAYEQVIAAGFHEATFTQTARAELESLDFGG